MSQAASGDRLDIRRVIDTTGVVLRRNLRTFAPWALLLIGLPLALLEAASGPSGGHAGGALLGLVLLVTGPVFHIALVRAVAADLEGAPVSMREGFTAARSLFLPLLGLMILLVLAISVGLVLLIVPGMMLAVAWAVVTQVLIIERPPVLQAFGRGADLTRGSRWTIFGLGLVVLGLELAGSLVVGVLGLGLPGLGVILATLVNIALSLITATGATVLYLELRQLQEDRAAVGSIGLSL